MEHLVRQQHKFSFLTVKKTTTQLTDHIQMHTQTCANKKDAQGQCYYSL